MYLRQLSLIKLLTLYSYVVNPFTKEAYFDFELFAKHVRIAQRVMDDIIDLEAEKIENILAKINSDPEVGGEECRTSFVGKNKDKDAPRT